MCAVVHRSAAKRIWIQQHSPGNHHPLQTLLRFPCRCRCRGHAGPPWCRRCRSSRSCSSQWCWPTGKVRIKVSGYIYCNDNIADCICIFFILTMRGKADHKQDYCIHQANIRCLSVLLLSLNYLKCWLLNVWMITLIGTFLHDVNNPGGLQSSRHRFMLSVCTVCTNTPRSSL